MEKQLGVFWLSGLFKSRSHFMTSHYSILIILSSTYAEYHHYTIIITLRVWLNGTVCKLIGHVRSLGLFIG